MDYIHRRSIVCFVIVLCFVLSAGNADESVCSKRVTVTSPEGIIESESFPYTIGENLTCVWDLDITKAVQPVALHFDDFWLADGDFMTITAGKVSQNFTGIKLPFSIIIAAQNSTIVLRTSSKKGERHFQAKYSSKDCQFPAYNTEQVFEHVISSPLYLATEGNLNCTWVLVPGRNRIASLSFIDFSLQANKLKVFNGTVSDAVLINYTGTAMPSDFIAPSALHITIELDLDLKVENSSFRAEFMSISEECAYNEVVNETSITLSPPQHPATEKQKCVWILEGPKQTIFTLNVEPQLNNPADVLIIGDGSRRYDNNIGMYSFASKDPANVATSGSKLYVFYSSTVTTKPSTFNITAQRQFSGGRHTSHGTFELPANIPANQSVVYNLVADVGKQVEVTILSKLNSGNELLFYEFIDNSQHDIATFYKNSTLYPVFSMSNRMVIEARNFGKADKLNGSFKSITHGCDQIDYLSLGSYQLDNTSGSCTWLIHPKNASNRIISVIFNSLHLGSEGHLAVYRGLSAVRENELVVFNSSLRYLPNIHIDAKDGVRVDTTFSKGSNVQEHGLLRAFYDVIPGCSGVRNLTSGNLTLRSPGYPTQYPLNANCSWDINLAENKSLMLNFTDVDVYSSDTFVIYARNASGHRSEIFNATGGSKPDNVVVNENITLVWTSLLSNRELLPVRGFSLDLLLLDGGTSLTNDKGEIDIPGKELAHFKGSFQCIWKVKVPSKPAAGKEYSVEFSYTTPPAKSSFVVHDGDSLSSPTFPPNASTSILSRYDTILVRYAAVNATGDKAMTLKFSELECGKSEQCGNGICLHKDWKCNGVNDCGNWADEKNCNESIIINKGVSNALLAVAIILSIIAGIALALVSPIAFRKIQAYRQRYHDFHTLPEE